MNPLVTQSISVHIDPNSSKTFHPHILKFPYLKTLTQFNQDMKLKNPADLLPSKNIDIQIRISHELSFHPQLRHIKKVYLLLAISNLFFYTQAIPFHSLPSQTKKCSRYWIKESIFFSLPQRKQEEFLLPQNSFYLPSFFCLCDERQQQGFETSETRGEGNEI